MSSFAHKKYLGQHFLHDKRIVSRIIESVQLKPNDLVVEIGPGLGALTESLSEGLSQLHVVEIDAECVERLGVSHFSQSLVIHHQDVLAFDFGQFSSPVRVVGNLPYNISTPLIFHCIAGREQIIDMHFMVQKEVLDRMAAEPNNKTYGRLSVMVQYYCQVESLFTVSPRAFSPPPKVMSAVCRLTPRLGTFRGRDADLFASVVQVAFAHRRKQLGHNLKRWLSKEGMLALGIDPTRRAENLTVAEFVHLARSIGSQTKS